MKILLFGPRGYLGEFFRQWPEVIATEVDIADSVAVAEELDRTKPDVVINAAGKTGRPNVDWCEDHKEETVRGNVTGPLVLLEECGKRGIYWVHLSSGCIYEGDNDGRGFGEEDEPNFRGSFYSRSKIWSDTILKEFPVLILRLRMPFSDSLHPRSLITKLSKYSKVLDVQNSITYLPDFLETAKKLITLKATGIYHVVNPGTVSPFDVMQMYKEVVDPAHTFERMPLENLSTVVRAGRSNCVLSTEKLSQKGIKLQPISSALRGALEAIKNGEK